MKPWFEEIQLAGELVRLMPLTLQHSEDILMAATDGKLWELWYTSVPSAQTLDAYLAEALDNKKKGTAFPFVVQHLPSGKIIGSTRYCNADAQNRRLEIGFTWYSQLYHRSGVNSECKYLLIKYAFEELDCIAVEFRTNWHNRQSREAISRLGAKQDGVLRNHKLNPDGSYRDTVVFSITNHEWPAVRQSLQYNQAKYH
jgi:N-acetyltransferase